MAKKKATIECIKEYYKNCPNLENADISTDYLNPDVTDNSKEFWSLEQDQTNNPIIKENVLGTKATIQFFFTFASRLMFNIQKDKQNIENLRKLEDIVEWTLQENSKRNRPILNDNEECLKIEITSSPYLYGTDKSMTQARYQFQGKITFERREK